MNIDRKNEKSDVSGDKHEKEEGNTLIENEKKMRVIEFSLNGIEFVLINLCVYGVFGFVCMCVCVWDDACVCVLYLSFEYTNKILESFINVRGGVEIT